MTLTLTRDTIFTYHKTRATSKQLPASTDKTTIIAIVIVVVVLTVLVITAISTKDTWIVNFTSIKQENSSTVNCKLSMMYDDTVK